MGGLPPVLLCCSAVSARRAQEHHLFIFRRSLPASLASHSITTMARRDTSRANKDFLLATQPPSWPCADKKIYSRDSTTMHWCGRVWRTVTLADKSPFPVCRCASLCVWLPALLSDKVYPCRPGSSSQCSVHPSPPKKARTQAPSVPHCSTTVKARCQFPLPKSAVTLLRR